MASINTGDAVGLRRIPQLIIAETARGEHEDH